MAGKHIYWVALRVEMSYPFNNGGIYRIMANGTGRQHVISTSIGENGIKDLTIDWIAGMIKFVSSVLIGCYDLF